MTCDPSWLTSGAAGVRIQEVRVPALVAEAAVSSLTLDCVFSAEAGERESLVVEWLFNHRTRPFYRSTLLSIIMTNYELL